METVTSPNYFLNETPKAYQLVFNLFGADRAQLHGYMSSDHKRLHVVAKCEGAEETKRSLWIFAMPANANVDAISIDRKESVYMIEIPKAS